MEPRNCVTLKKRKPQALYLQATHSLRHRLKPGDAIVSRGNPRGCAQQTLRTGYRAYQNQLAFLRNIEDDDES